MSPKYNRAVLWEGSQVDTTTTGSRVGWRAQGSRGSPLIPNIPPVSQERLECSLSSQGNPAPLVRAKGGCNSPSSQGTRDWEQGLPRRLERKMERKEGPCPWGRGWCHRLPPLLPCLPEGMLRAQRSRANGWTFFAVLLVLVCPSCPFLPVHVSWVRSQQIRPRLPLAISHHISLSFAVGAEGTSWPYGSYRETRPHGEWLAGLRPGAGMGLALCMCAQRSGCCAAMHILYPSCISIPSWQPAGIDDASTPREVEEGQLGVPGIKCSVLSGAGLWRSWRAGRPRPPSALNSRQVPLTAVYHKA